MNAEGLLRKQGWRGAGFSLDTSDRGIKKPLLISHKQDQLGLGKKKASHTTDDQWWMRAFDESLQNLGSGKTSTLSQIQEKGITRGGLYGFFVKGEGLQGSLGEESSAPTSGTTTPPTSAEDEETDDSESDSGPTSSSDAASDLSKMTKPSKGQNKRKREAEQDVPATKKLKQGLAGVKTNARAQINENGEVQTGIGPISADAWPKMCAITSAIDRQVKTRVKKNEKAGTYGDMKNIHDPMNPGAKLGKKATKQHRSKMIRTVKSQMAKELVVKAIVRGDLPMLNPSNWSKVEILQNYGTIDKSIKAVEKANKMLKKTERQAKKKQKKEAKAKATGEMARGKGAAPQRSAEQSTEQSTKQVTEKSTEQSTEQSIFETRLSQLSPEKEAEYAARAAEKGQTLKEYILRRIEKKTAKRGEESDNMVEKTDVVETKGDFEDGVAGKVQDKSQKKRKKKLGDQGAKPKPAGKLKARQKADLRAKAKNAKEGKEAKGNKEAEDTAFMEKAARFGAVAKPIPAAA